jgi:hypothetical protein
MELTLVLKAKPMLVVDSPHALLPSRLPRGGGGGDGCGTSERSMEGRAFRVQR